MERVMMHVTSSKKRRRGTILKLTHRRKYEGDEESDDARYSIKRRRRGQSQGGETINHRQTHSNIIHRIDYFGPQLLSHYYIKMRRRISRHHGDAKQARENRFLFPRSRRQKSTARILSSIIQIERRRRRNGERKPEVVAFVCRSARSAMVRT